MSGHMHAVALDAQPIPGQYVFLWEDVALRCTDPVIPGDGYCAEHRIEIEAAADGAP